MSEPFVYRPPVQPKTHEQLYREACQRPVYHSPQKRVDHKAREHFAVAGPYNGQTLILWSTPTLTFRARNRRGRYELNAGRLVWREIHHG